MQRESRHAISILWNDNQNIFHEEQTDRNEQMLINVLFFWHLWRRLVLYREPLVSFWEEKGSATQTHLITGALRGSSAMMLEKYSTWVPTLLLLLYPPPHRPVHPVHSPCPVLSLHFLCHCFPIFSSSLSPPTPLLHFLSFPRHSPRSLSPSLSPCLYLDFSLGKDALNPHRMWVSDP